MAIEDKIKAILERATPGSGAGDGIINQGTSVIDHKGTGDVEVLGVERVGQNASAKAGGAKPLPGSNSGGETAVVMQGSSKVKDEDEEQLGTPGNDRAPGKAASALAGGAKSLPGSNGGGEGVITQGSSATPTPGQPGSPGNVGAVGMPAGQQDEEAQAEFNAVLAEAGISEDAQTKLAEAFEKAVVARVEKEIEAASDTLAEAVQELAEANSKELFESVNAYLNYAVEQWMEQNKLAVETGLRAELTESFITGLKNLFVDHYIEMPDEKYDALAESVKKTETLESQLNEAIAKTVALTEEKRTLERRQIVERASVGMVATEAEKFAKLVEDVEFENTDSFAEKISVMKERFFQNDGKSKATLTETVENEPAGVETTSVEAYVKAISKTAKK
jgi:hypothetical protein